MLRYKCGELCNINANTDTFIDRTVDSIRSVIDLPAKGLPLNRPSLSWTVKPAVNHHPLTRDGTHAFAGAEASLIPPQSNTGHLQKKQRCCERAALYLVADWCRCLLWLSHFLCIRSLARQQWWCNVNGLQILKEERSGETEAAMFVCVCICVLWRVCSSCACACARGRKGGRAVCTV